MVLHIAKTIVVVRMKKLVIFIVRGTVAHIHPHTFSTSQAMAPHMAIITSLLGDWECDGLYYQEFCIEPNWVI